MSNSTIYHLSSLQSDLMDMAVHMRKTTTLEDAGMSRAIKIGRILAQGNPDLEDGPCVVEEPLWWERKGIHVSTTGGPTIRIRLNPTQKQRLIIAHGGLLIPSHIAPLMTTPIHTREVDPKGAHRSTATILVTGHHLQEMFTAIHLLGGQARQYTAVALSEVKKDLDFCIKSSGIDTLLEIATPEEGPMSFRVMAWSTGMRAKSSPIPIMESTDPLGHTGAPGRCMGEAQCQRGTGVKPQPGRITNVEARGGHMLALPWVIDDTAFLIQLVMKWELEGSEFCGFLCHKVEYWI